MDALPKFHGLQCFPFGFVFLLSLWLQAVFFSVSPFIGCLRLLLQMPLRMLLVSFVLCMLLLSFSWSLPLEVCVFCSGFFWLFLFVWLFLLHFMSHIVVLPFLTSRVTLSPRRSPLSPSHFNYVCVVLRVRVCDCASAYTCLCVSELRTCTCGVTRGAKRHNCLQRQAKITENTCVCLNALSLVQAFTKSHRVTGSYVKQLNVANWSWNRTL